MYSLLNRYKELLTVVVLLLYPLITFLWSGHRGREPNLADRLVLNASAPVQSAITWGVQGFGSTVESYVMLRNARDQERACRVDLSQTQAELNSLKEMQAENLRLKALLGYSQDSVEPEIPARVIGLTASSHFIALRLNRGENDGVHVNMPVVTNEGVVGYVIRAVGGSSEVMLVTDPNSRIGAQIQRSRVRANIIGSGGGEPLTLDNVLRSDDLLEGDTVVTSGTDDIFPKGLVLGKVVRVSKDLAGMFVTAKVAPTVDLRRVEEVLVLPVMSSLPAALAPPGGKP